MSAYGRLATGNSAITMQTRIRRTWKALYFDHHGKEQIIDIHTLLAMYSDLDDNGDVTAVMSCITDITHVKWPESQLRKDGAG